jgi:hypothetical protein
VIDSDVGSYDTLPSMLLSAVLLLLVSGMIQTQLFSVLHNRRDVADADGCTYRSVVTTAVVDGGSTVCY